MIFFPDGGQWTRNPVVGVYAGQNMTSNIWLSIDRHFICLRFISDHLSEPGVGGRGQGTVHSPRRGTHNLAPFAHVSDPRGEILGDKFS